jgi:hypothetical protein
MVQPLLLVRRVLLVVDRPVERQRRHTHVAHILRTAARRTSVLVQVVVSRSQSKGRG